MAMGQVSVLEAARGAGIRGRDVGHRISCCDVIGVGRAFLSVYRPLRA